MADVQCHCVYDRIVCRTGKLSGGNSSGDIVVTIDGMTVVWNTKFTYQVIFFMSGISLLYIVLRVILYFLCVFVDFFTCNKNAKFHSNYSCK